MAMFSKPKTASPVPTSTAVSRSEVKGSGTATPVSSNRVITHEKIRQRAYEIYRNRGHAAGCPVADWHEAERQLKAGL